MDGFKMSWLSTVVSAGVAMSIVAGASPAAAGPGVDQFEVKDLESDPGDLQFQSISAFSGGMPQRRVVTTGPGQYQFDDNSVTKARSALEMQAGITEWFRTRIGVEFEKGRLEDPGTPARANAFEDMRLASVAIEGVVVLKPIKGDGVGFGILTEFDSGIKEGGKQVYAGPIIQAVSGHWSALANLLLVQHFGSIDAGQGPVADRSVDFAYALQVQYEISRAWAVALEGYGTFDRILAPGNQEQSLSQFGRFDQHRAGPVVYYRIDLPPGPANIPKERGGVKGPGLGAGGLKQADDDDAPAGGNDRWVSIGVGVLFGLNANTPDRTIKLSLEYNW